MSAQKVGDLNYDLHMEDGFSYKREAAAFKQCLDERVKAHRSELLDVDFISDQYQTADQLATVAGIYDLVDQNTLRLADVSFNIMRAIIEAEAKGDTDKVNELSAQFYCVIVPRYNRTVQVAMATISEDDRKALQLGLGQTGKTEKNQEKLSWVAA